MLDLSHIPNGLGGADVQIFTGTSTAAGNDWKTWVKPRGKTMIDIILIGKGGNGGLGVVGANSAAAGGGGGGSGGQTRLTMPLALLPDILYLSLAGTSATTTLASYITIFPPLSGTTIVANMTLMTANGGGNGGNAAGATAGIAGAAAGIATVGNMPLGWAWSTVLAGKAGIAGGTTGAAGAMILPVTGLMVTGGTGGGGLPAAAAVGTAGGAFTVADRFPAHPGGVGGTNATTPPTNGTSGYQPIPKLFYLYGGTGGGSTHGSATTTGLVASIGGAGECGCGGGGNGGSLTGTTVATNGGIGGEAVAIITCW